MAIVMRFFKAALGGSGKPKKTTGNVIMFENGNERVFENGNTANWEN